MDTDSFLFIVETDDFYSDCAADVFELYDTSHFRKSLNRPLPHGINKKVLHKMKDELRGMILMADVCLKAKVYSYTYLNEDGKIVEVKNQKVYKKMLYKIT